MKKKIALLGSTGSIGTQTLKSCKNLGYEVTVLTANSNVSLLEQQAREFHPRHVVVSDQTAFADLKTRLADTDISVLAGLDSVCEVASLVENDLVCNAIVGIAGLRPTLAAIEAGKSVALANKETLVAGGQLVTEAATRKNVTIYPVDSEHSAILQCLQGNDRAAVSKILLTASGGPFRGMNAAALERVTLEDALRHPNWTMGAKITVDCATLMNKGLEFIEAMWLFGLTPAQIEVVVHPQSVVHSAVEYVDGSVLAQLGTPDMVIPIQYAMTYPHRAFTQVKRLSLTDCATLTFEKPDPSVFVCLQHCMDAARRGGLAPCAISGANEQAVALFLARRIAFADIGRCVGHVLENLDCKANKHYTLNEVLETDIAARAAVLEYCQSR